MGYCDTVYRPDNIIGYTGDLNRDPTVYFRATSTDEDGSPNTKQVGNNMQILFLHGHITQAHPTPTNIGREMVVESWSYSIMNAGAEHDDSGLIEPGKKALQEVYHSSEVRPDNRQYFATPDGFSDFHISRNVFNPVSMKDYATVMKLANALAKFPRIKQMYGPTDDGFIKRL